MNSNAKKLLTATKTHQTSIIVYLKSIVQYLMIARVAITVALLVWLILISILMMRERDDDSTMNSQASYVHTKYFALHQIWFGESSVMMFIFQLWYLVFIIWVVSTVAIKYYRDKTSTI